MIREPIRTRWNIVAAMFLFTLVPISLTGFLIEMTPMYDTSIHFWTDIYWKAILAVLSIEIVLMIYAVTREPIKRKRDILEKMLMPIFVFVLLWFVAFSLDISFKDILVFIFILSIDMLFMVLPLRYFGLALGVFSIALLLAGYTYLSHKQHLKNRDDRTIPTWSQLKQGVETIFKVDKRSHERWIVVDAKATGMRLFLGLLYGVLGAIILGLLMGCFPAVEAFFIPPLILCNNCSPIAMLAVFFVLVGTGMNLYITMIAFGVLPILAQSIYLAAKDMPDELLHKAYTLGASDTEAILCIVSRHIMPKLIDSVRLQIGPAIVFLLAAEVLCADIGFGYRMRLQSRLLNMDVVYPYIAIFACFAFAINKMIIWLQRRCCPWYVREGR